MKEVCPKCKKELLPVKVNVHYDSDTVVVDQCKSCGGIWFDPNEFYRVSDKDVNKLDGILINPIRVSTPNETTDKLECPRDKSTLVPFRDTVIPEEIKIDSCPTCSGYWFDFGELRALRESRKDSIKKDQIEGLDDYLKQVVEKYDYAKIEAISKVLSGKYIPEPEPEDPEDTKRIVFNVIMIILDVVIRTM